MVCVQRDDQICEKCGQVSGLYEMNCKTNEEWFVCESCGWGYQTACRRFGVDTLAELRDVLKSVKYCEAWPLVDSILRTLLSECKEHRPDDDDDVSKIRELLARDIPERTETDTEFVEGFAEYRSLFAMEAGRVVLDYIEGAPELVRIPLSALRPMSELDEFLRPRESDDEDGENPADQNP